MKTSEQGSRLIFPSPTLGRKVAYELRNLLRELKIPLYTFAKNFESDNFWEGIDIRKLQEDWLKEAGLIIQPSYIESRPLKLLQALAAGIPVIASEACGLEGFPNVTTINFNEKLSLKNALKVFLDGQDQQDSDSLTNF